MATIHRLLLHAARRLASDPRVQAKAAELYDKEVKPRAKAAWRETKPKIDAAKAELRDIAGEADPRKDPRKFARKVKERFFDRDKQR